jgi:hypothetical protein
VFLGLINSARTAVSSLILKYVARASVAVPFVIALGFALAAIAAMLVDRFGHITGYWLMAGGLAAIGAIAAIFVSAREQKEEVADQQAEAADTSKIATEVASKAPLAVLGGLLTLPGGGATALKVAQLLGRNYPLVLLTALIGLLFWPSAPVDDNHSRVQAQRLGRSFAQSISALDLQRRGNQSPESFLSCPSREFGQSPYATSAVQGREAGVRRLT